MGTCHFGCQFGGCHCCVRDVAAEKQMIAAKEIDKKLEEANKVDDSVYKILLLGPGDSGKTTIIKQMRKIHGATIKEEQEKEISGMCIQQSIMNYVKTLCDASVRLSKEYQTGVQGDNKEYVSQVLEPKFSKHLDEDMIPMILSIWNDEGIQNTLKYNKIKYSLPDNLTHWFNKEKLTKISRPMYIPDFEDYVRIRDRTTGVSSESFQVGISNRNFIFEFTDVGGQRCERKKWMEMIHGEMKAVLYVVAINEYDRFCYEDLHTNRMDEALTLFETVQKAGFFMDKTTIMFFNKYDLFTEKLSTINVKDSFPEFDKDPTNKHDVAHFFFDKFVDIYESEPKNRKRPHLHLVCSLDTDNVHRVMTSIQKDVVNLQLRRIGVV